MAKRTYIDALGYKKKKRPYRNSHRSTPQFSTVAQYEEWVREQRIKGTQENPASQYAGEAPKDPTVEALEGMLDRVEKNLPSGSHGSQQGEGDIDSRIIWKDRKRKGRSDNSPN